MAFSPDGKTLAVGHGRHLVDAHKEDGVILWDVAGQRRRATIPGSRIIFRFSPDGKLLVTAGSATVALWDATNGRQVGPPMTEAAEVNAVAFSPDGQLLVTGGTDGTARLWDVATGRPLDAPMLHGQRINVVAFSPDPAGRLILTACDDGSARLWDRVTQKRLGPPVLQGRALWAATFAPDGRSFVTTAEGGESRSWPVPTALGGDPDGLALRLRVRTGLEMGPGQTVVELSPAAWGRCREQLAGQAGSAESAYASPVSEPAFHDTRARDAEAEGAAFVARWHLGRLIAAQDGSASSWLAYARRARGFTDAGLFDEAEADYRTALKLGPRDELLCWSRQRVADCLVAKKWQAALWYLDRTAAVAPPDWQWYDDRARAEGGLGRLAEREADLTRAAEHGANPPFMLRLGAEYAARGQWHKAANTITHAGVGAACPFVTWEPQALVLLKAGDRGAYQRLCAGLDEGVRELPYAAVLSTAAWVWALAPDGVRDYSRPVAVAEAAVRVAPPEQKPGFLKAQGAILYRAGRLREAVERLNASVQSGTGAVQAQGWCFLTMAHYRLGEEDRARAFLDRALQARAAAGSAWDTVALQLLRQEAKALVESSASRDD
jgi:tetratricopeptide (TPR) repeat protein